MSKYADLIVELNEVLEKRRSLCGPKSVLGMVPTIGNEKEWQELTDKADEIRKEMRHERYGI